MLIAKPIRQTFRLRGSQLLRLKITNYSRSRVAEGSITAWRAFKCKCRLPIAVNLNLNGNLIAADDSYQLRTEFLRRLRVTLILFINPIDTGKLSFKSFVNCTKCNARLKFTIQFEMHFSSSLHSLHIVCLLLFICCESVPVLSPCIHCRLAHDKLGK